MKLRPRSARPQLSPIAATRQGFLRGNQEIPSHTSQVRFGIADWTGGASVVTERNVMRVASLRPVTDLVLSGATPRQSEPAGLCAAYGGSWRIRRPSRSRPLTSSRPTQQEAVDDDTRRTRTQCRHIPLRSRRNTLRTLDAQSAEARLPSLRSRP